MLESAEFQLRLNDLVAAKITPEWFDQLADFYRDCSDDQNKLARYRFGWGEQDCTEPSNSFAACVSDRLKPEICTYDLASNLIRTLVVEGSSDWRDDMISIVLLWHAIILAGYDAPGLFSQAMNVADSHYAGRTETFLKRTDWRHWRSWGFHIARDEKGRVNIYSTGVHIGGTY